MVGHGVTGCGDAVPSSCVGWMGAVGSVNCDAPGGAPVNVVPLLTPRKSCGGRACGFPRGVAGVVVQEGNDGVGWLAGRGGLLKSPFCTTSQNLPVGVSSWCGGSVGTQSSRRLRPYLAVAAWFWSAVVRGRAPPHVSAGVGGLQNTPLFPSCTLGGLWGCPHGCGGRMGAVVGGRWLRGNTQTPL